MIRPQLLFRWTLGENMLREVDEPQTLLHIKGEAYRLQQSYLQTQLRDGAIYTTQEWEDI